MPTEFYKNTICVNANSAQEWRKWLIENHESHKNAWLIFYKKNSGKSTLTWQQAVEEALCFGWIDSKPNKRDDQSSYRFFSQRNPKSNWSAINKKLIEKLNSENKMFPQGINAVNIAKENGTWDALNDVDNLIVPNDLQTNFNANLTALHCWNEFPRSVKRGILEWILAAKTAETRNKRINETVTLAEKNIRANQYPRK